MGWVGGNTCILIIVKRFILAVLAGRITIVCKIMPIRRNKKKIIAAHCDIMIHVCMPLASID